MFHYTRRQHTCKPMHVYSDVISRAIRHVHMYPAATQKGVTDLCLAMSIWGVSNTAKLRTRLRNLCKITPGLHRDYTQVFNRLLKNTYMCWQNQNYKLKNYKRVHRDYRASVRDYSHVADPSCLLQCTCILPVAIKDFLCSYSYRYV